MPIWLELRNISKLLPLLDIRGGRMHNDRYPSFEYLTQTQIGKMYGTTSIAVGQWLKQVGLRLPNGSPSPKAIDGGVGKNFCPDGSSRGFWVWKKDVIAKVFDAAGHIRPLAETSEDVHPDVT
jgi:hypothetical protein